MPPILTAEDVVRRIAVECAYVDERGGVGIRLEPAAAIVRRYGEQFRRPPRRKQARYSWSLLASIGARGALARTRPLKVVMGHYLKVEHGGG
jgi:hypothetical protein